MVKKLETQTPDLNEAIVPAKLKPGTIIFLETNANVYELEVLAEGRAFISSASQKVRQTPCTIIGSVNTGAIIAGKILKDHHLIVSLPKRRFATGLIKGASVTNGKYTYDLWKE